MCRKFDTIEVSIKKRYRNGKDHIVVHGARSHNLKNIDVSIPRDKFVVITGLSGSGEELAGV